MKIGDAMLLVVLAGLLSVAGLLVLSELVEAKGATVMDSARFDLAGTPRPASPTMGALEVQAGVAVVAPGGVRVEARK